MADCEMDEKKVTAPYWDIGKSLSYQCLFNFIVGPRGNGKTFGFKQWAIRDFIRNGNQFIYVRRYKEEFRAKIDKFFDDIHDKFPMHELEVYTKGNCFMIDHEVAGYYIPLSTAKTAKSVPYPLVTKICFDEFIIDSGNYHYLKDEVTAFLELYMTIARSRDVTVYFLSNSVTSTNPYFSYFNVRLPYGNDIARQGDVLVEKVRSIEWEKYMSETRISKLVKGTPYYDYAIKNEFLRDNKTFVQKKTANSEYYFTLIYKGIKYGVWIDYLAGLLFVSENVDLNYPNVYSFTSDDHSPNMILLKGGVKPFKIKLFCQQYQLGSVRFESVKIKAEMMEAMRMVNMV